MPGRIVYVSEEIESFEGRVAKVVEIIHPAVQAEEGDIFGAELVGAFEATTVSL